MCNRNCCLKIAGRHVCRQICVSLSALCVSLSAIIVFHGVLDCVHDVRLVVDLVCPPNVSFS